MNDKQGSPPETPDSAAVANGVGPEINPDILAAVKAAMAERGGPEPAAPAPNVYNVREDSEVLDLDAVIQHIDVGPKPVRLGGRRYLVRRDFTTPEYNELMQAVNRGDDALAFSMLVGRDDGPVLNDLMDALPRPQMLTVLSRLAEVSGLTTVAGGTGEVSAPSRQR